MTMISKKTNLILGVLASLILYACSSTQDVDYDLIPVRQVDTWGYIDHNGTWVINPQFEEAECFFDGLARVKSNGKIGYINKEGRLVINAIYQDGTRFSEGRAFVSTDDEKFICIDTEGNTKFEQQDNVNESGIFFNSIALVAKDGKVGYIKTDGTTAIDFTYNNGFYQCKEGLVGVIQDGKFGFCDIKGNVVISPQFQSTSFFCEGLCAVSDGNKWGFINKDGKYVINPQFEEVSSFSEGLCRIKQGGKYGFIDHTGKIVINPQFEDSWDFKGSLCSVKQNGKFGYIDKEGKIVINPQFDWASMFYGELAAVSNNGQVGFINKQGKYEINPQFADLNLPDRFQVSVKKTATSGSTAPRMSFIEAVFQNSVAESENIGKKISAAKKLENPTYDKQYVFYPANVNVKGVVEANNFWLCDSDLKNGKNTTATIKATGLYLKFNYDVDIDVVDKYVADYIEYVCYEKELFDVDEFGPYFGHGIKSDGHYMAWVYNPKQYLSYFLDHVTLNVFIYVGKDDKYMDKMSQKFMKYDELKELAGESFENMF